MLTRREILKFTVAAAFAGSAALLKNARGEPSGDHSVHHAGSTSNGSGKQNLQYKPVVTPNGSALGWIMKDGVKEFHLIAEPLEREFAPGMTVKCWGYNGQTPGPTLEAIEGDRVRILVTNKLPEHTTVHWHGIFVPNGMDGVGGLIQPHIKPGETWAYEFTLRQHGTFMYHPHADEMLQMAAGMMGFFIIHPRELENPLVGRDFAIMLHGWAIHPGTYRPDPAVMTDFNIFTFNGKVFPAIEHLVVKTGDRVRIRLGNLSMDEHPIHIHGHNFIVTATDGGKVPPAAQFPETTVLVPVGATRDIEFIADNPGDWPFHCHKSHHTMNAMAHVLPNLLGVSQRGLEEKIKAILPGYFAHGEGGMAEHAEHLPHIQGPRNTLPMMTGIGPYGNIEMGGMFTVIKIRDNLPTYDKDPGWYRPPEGTAAYRLKER